MTDEELAAVHATLAEYHRKLTKEAALDIVQQYHADLAQRLADEAAQIPRRTAILERLREREQQKPEDGDVDK
jgi:CHASE3 domain sensor protein